MSERNKPKIKKRLGSGSFGDVYLGEFYYLKGQLFALKKVVNIQEKIAKQEIQILAGVDEGVEHPNIIKYHMAYMERSVPYSSAGRPVGLEDQSQPLRVAKLRESTTHIAICVQRVASKMRGEVSKV